MSQEMHSDTSSLSMDKMKWVMVAICMIAAIIASFYCKQNVIRWGILIAASIVSLGLASQTLSGRQFKHFCIDARVELRKVVWPTRGETIRAASLILGMVFVAGFVLWAVDNIIWRIVAWVTGFRA